MRLFLIALLYAVANVGLGEKINFAGYRIIRVYLENEEQWQGVKSLNRLGIESFLQRESHVDLLFPPHLLDLLDGIRDSGIQFETLLEDVQKTIDSQKVNDEPIIDGSLEWDRYYRLEDIHQFLDEQAAKHNEIATTASIGLTYEGRDMKILKISKSGETKPAIWIDSNIHAREWITGAVCTFVIDQLLNSNDTEIESWLDEYDFYILPIFNADGYEFTHTTNRFWRKSRLPNGSPVGCIGTDLNRNWDNHWLENGGASPDPCSSSFGGPEVWSDIETRNARDFLNSISSRLQFFLTLHSSGQYILFPTGFSGDKIAQYNTYMTIGNLTRDAHAERFGTVFKPGSIFDEMYVATGSSLDWVKETLKTTLTLAYELRDKGQYGHLLPPDQILPSGLEFMDGFRVLIRQLLQGIPDVDP